MMEWTEQELIELYEERAAIMQHDGGMTQEAAENAAYYEWRRTVGRGVVVPDVIRGRVRKFRN
jgi:hypothetical protein